MSEFAQGRDPLTALLKGDHPSHRWLERLPVAAYTCDADGLITFYNRFAADLWGREPLLNDPAECFCGSSRLFSADGQPLPFERSWMALAIRDDREYRGEEILVERPGGERRTVLAHATPFHDASGRVCGALNLLIDVTEQRRAEAAARLRDRALDSFSQGVCIADATLPEYPITYINQGFTRITGYAPEEVIGRNGRFLQGPKTDPAAVAKVREAIFEGRPCAVELLNYRKDGTTFWNALSLSPVHDESGRLTHYVGVQTDVTRSRKIEEQLRQAQKMEALGHLAGGVAHDFNNMLTVINGYSEILIPRFDPDDTTRIFLTEIARAGERAAAMTRQLLAFSRQQVLEPRVLDLNAEIRDAERLLRRLIGEDILLTTVLAPGLGRVRVDPGQMQQVLLNLAVNSRDAMPQGGRLTIETRDVTLDENVVRANPAARPVAYAMLSVSDTGCGMDEETRQHLFEPFFTTKGPGKGTGLGLATVYGIVTQSGGFIDVYTEAGLGTTFKVYLPQVKGPLSTSKSHPGLRPLVRGTETVLLAEDEAAVRSLAVQILRSCGYEVVEAGDGQEAIRVAEQYPGRIDLVITDVVMPHVSGRMLVERLAALRPGVKVLYLSGYTDDAIIRHGLLEAEVAFLQKPFTASGLAQKVRDVLDEVR
jgi:two-component system cell cycle sensor histidine kinase/response regulator CckA